MGRYQDDQFLDAVITEIKKARAEFPKQDKWVTLAALTEEVGELNQATLQRHFEREKGKTAEDVMKEPVQVAVMAMRVALDCGDL